MGSWFNTDLFVTLLDTQSVRLLKQFIIFFSTWCRDTLLFSPLTIFSISKINRSTLILNFLSNKMSMLCIHPILVQKDKIELIRSFYIQLLGSDWSSYICWHSCAGVVEPAFWRHTSVYILESNRTMSLLTQLFDIPPLCVENNKIFTQMPTTTTTTTPPPKHHRHTFVGEPKLLQKPWGGVVVADIPHISHIPSGTKTAGESPFSHYSHSHVITITNHIRNPIPLLYSYQQARIFKTFYTELGNCFARVLDIKPRIVHPHHKHLLQQD